MIDARTGAMLPLRRIVAVAYDAIEFQEVMSDLCVEYKRELGYLAVVEGEVVWVYEATKTASTPIRFLRTSQKNWGGSRTGYWFARPPPTPSWRTHSRRTPPDALVADYTLDATDLYATDGWEEFFSC